MGTKNVSLQPYELVDEKEGILAIPHRWRNPVKELRGLQPGKYVMLLTVHPERIHYSVTEMGKPKESL